MSSDDQTEVFTNPMIEWDGDAYGDPVGRYHIDNKVFDCELYDVQVHVKKKPKPRFPVGTVLHIDDFPSWFYTRGMDSWYFWKSGSSSVRDWKKTDTPDQNFQEMIIKGTAKILYTPISGK